MTELATIKPKRVSRLIAHENRRLQAATGELLHHFQRRGIELNFSTALLCLAQALVVFEDPQLADGVCPDKEKGE